MKNVKMKILIFMNIVSFIKLFDTRIILKSKSIIILLFVKMLFMPHVILLLKKDFTF